MLPFESNGHLTLGVEIELQLLNKETGDLKPAALDILAQTAHYDKIKPEIFQSMLEINTGICRDVHEAGKDIQESLRILHDTCDKKDILISTTGTHPFAKYSDRIPFPAERYQYLIDRNQWIARRLMIFGMHIHIGMKDGDSCIRYNNFLLHFIPHLTALTASSPFWQSDNTGLASCRNTIFESCPTAGHPCRVHNWLEFSDLCDQMIACNAIRGLKDIWWDIRPSPKFGTLEVRACDGPATLQETNAVVAFIHALAHWYHEHGEYDTEHLAPLTWIMRENKWRATRHGMEALLIKDRGNNLIHMRADLRFWMDQSWPYAQKLGYEQYWKDLNTIIEQGNSSQRQMKVFEQTQSLEAVAMHNANECRTGVPIYV